MLTPVPTRPTTDAAQGPEPPSLRALLQQVEDEYNRSVAGLLSENIELRRRLSCLTGEHDEQQKLVCDHDDAEIATAGVLDTELSRVPHVLDACQLPPTKTASHSVESLFTNIDCFGRGWVNASDIEDAMKRGKDDLPSDMLTRIQEMIEVVHMTVPEPEEYRPERLLGLQGFKFIMLADDLEETLGEEVAETVKLVRGGCLERAANSVIAQVLDERHMTIASAETTGWQKFLELVLPSVIFANAICIGVSADYYKEHVFWKVLEVFFTLSFVLELVIKLKEKGVAEHFFGSDYLWSWLDFTIVLLSLLDTVLIFLEIFIDLGDNWDLNKSSILRLVRLVRVTRLVKVLRINFLKELSVMISCVISGMRTLFWAFVLLLLLVYILGVLMRQVTTDVSECDPLGKGCSVSELRLHKYHEELFGTVFRSMFTVFRCFTDGCSAPDGTPLQVLLWDTHGWIFVLGYTISLLFVMFGVFNIIAAVFVENVLESAKLDELRRHMLQHESTLLLAEDLRHLLHIILNNCSLDRDQSNSSQGNNYYESKHLRTSITKQTFKRLMLHPDVQKILGDLEVSVYERGKLFDILDANGDGKLGVTEMVEGLLRLRGPVDKADVVSSSLMLRCVREGISLVDAKITGHQQLMERMRTELANALGELKEQVSVRTI